MGKSTISMVIFNSFLLVYQRVGSFQALWCPGEAGFLLHGEYLMVDKYQVEHVLVLQKGIVYIYIHMGEWFRDIH